MADLNELSEKLSSIKAEIKAELEKKETSKSVFEYRKTIFDSKTGKIGSLMREMGKIPNEMKAEYGKRVNEMKAWAQDMFEEMDEKFRKEEMKHRYESEKLDVTMPAREIKIGYLHPNTLIRNRIVDIFGSMGFEIYEGTEIETDYYNFTALNTPDDHPARDMQDTFYLSDKFLLRTQTSAGQIHVMEAKKPPIKIISPGKVFRSDDDATHSPMFSQMEGLVVDKGYLFHLVTGDGSQFPKFLFSLGYLPDANERPGLFQFFL